MQGVRPGNFLIGQPRNPFAWSNFDPITRTTVETVADGLGALTPPTISTFTANSLGPGLASLGVATPASATVVGANNHILYVPFFLSRTVTVVSGFAYNGATVGNQIDIGVYDSNWARLVRTGVTTQSGTNAIQTIDLTDTELSPGTYYLGLGIQTATSTFFRFTATGFADMLSLLGAQDESDPGGSWTGLPSTATPTAWGNAALPLFGVNIEF